MANKYITDEIFKKGISDVMQTMADNTYEFEPYSDEEIASAFELSSEEQRSLSEVINDTVYAKNKVYSSEYTLELLEKAKAECNQYSVEQLANSGNLKRKIVSSDSEVIDENILYLILTDSTNNIYTQYMLIDGTATPLGNTQIDLSDYLLIDDFNTTIADYAKKTEVVSQNDVVNDLTTVSSSTVLSSQGTSNELDKKVDKTSIATSIDSTSTDEQIASAKAVNSELDKKLNANELVVADKGKWTALQCELTDGSKSYRLQLDKNGNVNVFDSTDNWVTYTWKRVCDTKIDDIPKTAINYDTGVFETGEIVYEVINGICYVRIMALKSKSIVNNYEIASTPMPKPKHGLATCPITCDGDGSNIGMFYVDSNFNSLPKCHIYNTVKNGYCTFSYPVAES